MAKICLHCFVTGRVQGVCFRRNTVKQAESYGVTGWVRNSSDGRVEVMICGEKALVESLRDWLWEGPPAAQVIGVEVSEAPIQEYAQFEVR